MPIWNFCNFFILKLLFKLSRPYEVASRGYSFIISFSKELVLQEKILSFCTREIWIITACLGLINATASRYSDGLVAPDIEKEFYHVQGDLYSLCQTKVCTQLCLPWPKPAVWPSVPSDASSEVLEKEKVERLLESNLEIPFLYSPFANPEVYFRG